MYIEDHVLYAKTTCPFCRRVLTFMNKSDIECEIVDTDNIENANKLEELTGKRTVPCLFIKGEPMWESMDIISYFNDLKNNK